MTYKQAIKQLEDDALFKGASEEINPLYAAYMVAIDAMEKQIPKKLIPNQYREWDCPNCNSSINVILYQGAYCPNCGQHWEKYPEKLTDKNDGLPYCSGCGQALD